MLVGGKHSLAEPAGRQVVGSVWSEREATSADSRVTREAEAGSQETVHAPSCHCLPWGTGEETTGDGRDAARRRGERLHLAPILMDMFVSGSQ